MKKTATPKVFRTAIPGYRKNNIYLRPVWNPSVNTASYWDDGSRTYYSTYNLATREQAYCPTGTYPAFVASHELRPGEVILTSGTFRGKTATGSIVYRAEDEAEVFAHFGILETITI